MNIAIRTKLYPAIYCALGTVALCALSISVGASEQDNPPTKTVHFGDLNIAKPAGAKVLYARIRAAAREVCEISTRGDPIMKPAMNRCIETAIDKAVRGVNAPELTALRFGSDVRLASK